MLKYLSLFVFSSCRTGFGTPSDSVGMSQCILECSVGKSKTQWLRKYPSILARGRRGTGRWRRQRMHCNLPSDNRNVCCLGFESNLTVFSGDNDSSVMERQQECASSCIGGRQKGTGLSTYASEPNRTR